MDETITFLRLNLLGRWIKNNFYQEGRLFDGFYELAFKSSNFNHFDREVFLLDPRNSIPVKQMGPKCDPLNSKDYYTLFDCMHWTSLHELYKKLINRSQCISMAQAKDRRRQTTLLA